MMGQQCTNRFVALAVLACLTLTSGCFYQTSFQYGKSTGNSVNGVSVFANALRERGHSVMRKKRLSKRFDSFDTIVWAPDNRHHPPENVAAWLEEWISKGNERVLIYVGRSYDGKIPYHRGKFETAEPEERENWQRELADALIEDREFVFDFSFGLQDDTTPYWFDREVDLKAEAEEELAAVEKAIADKSSAVTAGAVPASAIPIDTGPTDEELQVDLQAAKDALLKFPLVRDPSALGGPWAQGVDPSLVTLECENLLLPLADYNDDSKFPALSTENDEGGYQYIYWDEFRAHPLALKNC